MPIPVLATMTESLAAEPSLTQNSNQDTEELDQYRNGQNEGKRFAELISIDNCNKGLGLKICGGCSIDATSLYGIFIKYVIPGGVAANSGQLQNGDQILSVNAESLEGVTRERAIAILRRAASENHAEIVVTRDDEARAEYIEVLEKEHSLISSPVNLTNSSTGLDQSLYNGDSSYLSGVNPLESPWKQFASSPTLFNITESEKESPRNTTLTRKATLDPSDKVDLEKLQGRLHYLGLEPSPSQIKDLFQHLVIDSYNQVTFGNFMQAVKIVFEEELSFHKGNNSSSIKTSPSKSVNSLNSRDYNVVDNNSEDFDFICQHRDELKQQVNKLEVLLQSQESKYDMELLSIRKETQAAIEENRSLKTRVHLAEQAQVESQALEHDYEEAVAFLENEIRDLRNQLKQNNQATPVPEDKRVAALASQLKKSEAQLKMYHAATEKLVTYVEHVQEVLTQPVEPRKNEDEVKKKERRDQKKASVLSLINDGQSVIKLVKSLTEKAPLPFGWEEAFSEDGTRYYINHLTMTTSWTHPTSGVQHISPENKPSTSKS